MTSDSSRSNNLIDEWSRVSELVTEIRELIDEMADAYADSPGNDESCPGDTVAERVAALANQLKSNFADEESHGFIADLYRTVPQLSHELAGLRVERLRLLVVLDDVGELAGMPTQSVSTWNDLEHRFQQFTTLLANQEQSEALLIRRAVLEDAEKP